MTGPNRPQDHPEGLRAVLARGRMAASRSRRLTRIAARLSTHLEGVVYLRLGHDIDHRTNGELMLVRLLAPTAASFVDVGANVGHWTELFLQSAPSSVRGVLIEPGGAASTALAERFAGDERVEIVIAAAGEDQGEISFYEEPGAGEMSSVITGVSRPDAELRRVPVTTLDAQVAERGLDFVDVIKIDAEGYDLHVLRGARGLLAEQRCGVVQFEYNSSWRLARSTLAAAYAVLESAGYQVFLLRGDGLFQFDFDAYGEFFHYANFVAISPAKLPAMGPLMRGRI